ncbi:hypothetical protein ACM55G_04430 [Flavobacterium sp. LB3P122]|uniref:hypothetical protein n=1 Tax=Flavobacterium algoriphilum TaxID=3398738 RepID=UPI003A8B8174
MKKNICHSIYILAIMMFFTSCEKNEFEIVSHKNILIKNKEISKLDIVGPAINWAHFKKYHSQFDGNYEQTILLKGFLREELFEQKLKGIRSKLNIQNNSNQIIERSNLTVRIKYVFENDKEFNYVKSYTLLPSNKIWMKNETLEFDINDVVFFSASDEKKILTIHTPKNVTIEYYITAKNSIGYNSLDKTTETINTDFYAGGGGKYIGIFKSAILKENEILGFGDKILSNDITDLWNETLNQSQNNEKPKNGDLDYTFNKQEILKKENKEKFKKEKERLIAEGWREEEIINGQLSSCYNYKPKKGNIKNRLEVIVGGGTDVSLKIMNIETEKCIRYVFINSGSTYSIDYIPEGEYYLKIAYGKNWLSKIENGQCIGKFIKNPMYEKGDDILNFNIQRDSKGRNIPSYQLSLDVVSNGVSNSFNSQNISESDFNK